MLIFSTFYVNITEMKAQNKEKKFIGRAERVRFPGLGDLTVHARIDSGAKTSAIWGEAQVENDHLVVTFFGDNTLTQTFSSYDTTVVASSNGNPEKRYKVKLLVVVKGKKVLATFTIANRESQVYPVLVGRNILRGKFIVDVTLGKTLTAAEKQRTSSLRTLLEKEELL